jgi:hypothetical protein
MASLVAAVRAGKPSLIPFAEICEVTQATFDIVKAANR